MNIIIRNDKRMKKRIKLSIAIIISILALITILNYNISFATVGAESNSTDVNVMQVVSFIDGFIGTIPAAFIAVIKIVLLFVLTALSWIVGFVVSGQGMLTLDKILFNELPLINLEFNPQKAGDYSGFVGAISGAVQVILGVAIAIQFLVLLITMIRYMTKSLAKDKAETKTLLTNWLKGVGIMFGVLLFMFTVIAINNSLVGAVKAGLNQGQSAFFKGVTNEVLKNALINQGFGGVVSTFIYIAILAQTVFFYFYYVKRFIIVAFLMMIAPIITATYALDMIDDKKSQTLQFWTNKFLHTVFIQLFHLFIYVALILPMVTGNANSEWLIRPTEITKYIEKSVLTVFGMLFFFKGEALLKKIFGLKAEGTQSSAVGTMMVVDKLSKSVNKAIKARSDYSNTKATNDKISNNMEKVRTTEKTGTTSPKSTATSSTSTTGPTRVVSAAEKKKMEDFKNTVKKTKTSFSADDVAKERKAFNKMQKNQEKQFKEPFKKRVLKSIARGTVAATAAFTSTAITAGLKNMDATDAWVVGEKAKERALENYDNLKNIKQAKEDGQILPSTIQKNTKKGKEEIKKQYDRTVEKFATQNAQDLQDLEKLTGTKLTSETNEGKDNQKAYFEMLKNNEEKINEEFENAKKELIKHLRKELGDTATISEEIVMRMQDELEERRTIITKGMDDKVKDFVIKYKEKQLIEMMHTFEEMTKRVNDKIVPEKKDEELGRYSDVVSALPKVEDRLKKVNLLKDPDKLDPDSEEDLEDAMYFDTIVRDVFKGLGRL